jgi:hypothetical protein
MNIDGRKLEINGRIIALSPKESVFLKLLFEKINTYVPVDDLYVAVYGGKAGDWKKDSKEEKKRFYSLLTYLRKKIPANCIGISRVSVFALSLLNFERIRIVSAFNFLSHRCIRILRGHDRTRKHISYRRLTFKAIFGNLLT